MKRNFLFLSIFSLLLNCEKVEKNFKEKEKAIVCTEENIDDSAFLPAGKIDEGSFILPDGKKITPQGIHIWTAGVFPIGIAVSKNEKRAYISHNGDKSNSIIFIDLEKKEIAQTIGGISVFRGITLNSDETFLFAGGGDGGKIYAFSVLQDGKLEFKKEKLLGGYIGDILLLEDKGVIYAVSNTNSKIFELKIDDFEVKRVLKAEIFPYDLIYDKKNSLLFVSNVGSFTVSAISLEKGENVASIKVGKNPQGMALSENRRLLFVANSDSDSVSVINIDKLEEIKKIDLSGNPYGYKGGGVIGIAVSKDEKLLFVSHARLNKIDVITIPDYEILTSIPTGWYPTEIALTANGEEILILNYKGVGAIETLKNKVGLLQIIKFSEMNEKLKEWSEMVQENNMRTTKFFKDGCSPDKILPLKGKDSPIKHVVLIVRENKTYDAVLGDFERGKGDPNLVLFGEKYTPNLHKLAREFVNLDNFYSNPEVSIQGHLWTTTADCNDYVEKLWKEQIPIAGYEPAGIGESGSIFDLLYSQGRNFRNYGEFVGFAAHLLDEYKEFINHKFPFFNLDIRDVDKAEEFIRELNLGIFPEFVYIALPNDHTFGTKIGKPTPESMVADNDLATGMIVEAISKSIYWPQTIIFIIEDDPQSYKGDHVDAHRSICVVVSPWVKREYTSSVHYDIPSIYKTIGMILDLPAMNKNDMYAAPMADIFTDTPDYTPFTAVPVDVPFRYNTKESPLTEESEKIDFSKPDRAKGLGYILWRYMKGDIEPPPYAKGIDE